MAANTRREFLKQAAIGAAALAAYPPPSVLGSNDRVRVGMIGVGDRGEDLLKQVLQVPNAQLPTFTRGGAKPPSRWRPAFRRWTITGVCWT